MPTLSVTANSTSPVKITASTDTAYGIVSFLNSGAADVKLMEVGDGSTPAAGDFTDAETVLLKSNNGNQIQLQDSVNGKRLDFWWALSTGADSLVGVAW